MLVSHEYTSYWMANWFTTDWASNGTNRNFVKGYSKMYFY